MQAPCSPERRPGGMDAFLRLSLILLHSDFTFICKKGKVYFCFFLKFCSNVYDHSFAFFLFLFIFLLQSEKVIFKMFCLTESHPSPGSRGRCVPPSGTSLRPVERLLGPDSAPGRRPARRANARAPGSGPGLGLPGACSLNFLRKIVSLKSRALNHF